jgi:hypothetical protein
MSDCICTFRPFLTALSDSTLRRTWLVSASLLAGLVCGGVGQARQIAPWAERISSQPFESQPLHAVRIPAWVEDTVGCGYTLSVMDAEARRRAVEHGVTISEMGFVDPLYVYYDSRFLERRNPHVAPDRLERDIADYNRLGVRILAVYPPSLQGEVYEKHPEWRRVESDSTEIPQVDLARFPQGGMLCLLGPYGDFMIEVLAEILTRFPDVAAFSFDGLHYGGVCYCRNCRDAYRKATGGSAIPRVDLDALEFRRYQHWADRRMEDFVRRMQSRLKAIKPTVALVTWTTNAGRFGHFLSIPRNMPSRMNLLLDAPDQEFWLDETDRGASIVPAFANAYIWATTNHRVAFSEPYLIPHGNPYTKDSFPALEVLHRMMLALTYGASPSIAVGQPAHLQQAVYTAMDEVQKRRPWLTHKVPEPWAALAMSDNTRTFYGRTPGAVEERYLASVFGMFRAAVEEHLPVAVINDWNLNDDDLARYAVLLLPNTACLDASQLAAVERFVRRGGGLVASLDTSLCDEFGSPRVDFGLAGVLGATRAGTLDGEPGNRTIDVKSAPALDVSFWEKRKKTFTFERATRPTVGSARLAAFMSDARTTFKGPAAAVSAADEKWIGAVLRLPGQAANTPGTPGMISHGLGQGRVVYFAAGLDAAYYLYSYPYQRVLLSDAIRWAASKPPPVTVQAPMCVHMSVMRQRANNHDRLIVHLYNDANSTAFHALPNNDVPLREETLPVHDLTVTFRSDLAVGSIRLEPEGRPLEPDHTQAGTRVRVPRLGVHSMVVAELGPAAGPVQRRP